MTSLTLEEYRLTPNRSQLWSIDWADTSPSWPYFTHPQARCTGVPTCYSVAPLPDRNLRFHSQRHESPQPNSAATRSFCAQQLAYQAGLQMSLANDCNLPQATLAAVFITTTPSVSHRAKNSPSARCIPSYFSMPRLRRHRVRLRLPNQLLQCQSLLSGDLLAKQLATSKNASIRGAISYRS